MLFLLLGCAELLTIEIEQTAVTVVESGTLLEDLIGDLGFSGFVSMDLTDSEELANQGVEPGDITGAKLVLLQLTAAWKAPLDAAAAAVPAAAAVANPCGRLRCQTGCV